MFPQRAAVPFAELRPTAFVGDEAGVEGVALGPADDFLLAATVEGRQ